MTSAGLGSAVLQEGSCKASTAQLLSLTQQRRWRTGPFHITAVQTHDSKHHTPAIHPCRLQERQQHTTKHTQLSSLSSLSSFSTQQFQPPPTLPSLVSS